jgi:MoaA/NifB/PqqE/SkfB family radical SAM enzyme
MERLRAELEHWRGEGHESVGFLGGEPTIYHGIVEAVAYAAALGYSRIAIATNGMRLADAGLTDRLVEAGLTRATVSMHGHTAALEDRLTAVAGSFERKRRGLGNLVAHRDAGRLRDGVSVNAVLCAYNARHLPRMMRFFFEELDLRDLRVNFVRPEGNAAGDRALVGTYASASEVLLKAVVLNERHFRRVLTFGEMPLCTLPAALLRDERLLARYAGDAFRDLSTDCSIRSEGVDDGVSVVEDGQARFNW